MNRQNLQRMADYIRTIPQSKFSMHNYRASDDWNNKECNSVGCVIGHCVILDPRPLSRLPKNVNDSILFREWARQFTGLSRGADEWDYLFGFAWTHLDNTPEGAALRIEWLLQNGLPADWEEQMEGEAPLCYKQTTAQP